MAPCVIAYQLVSGALAMVNPRASEAGDVRAQVLAAATRLLASRGFEGTTIQSIADEVGVTKPAVLHHFASKELLRQAVLDAIVDHWQEALPKLLKAATASEDRFDAVLGELWRFFSRSPDRARLVLREVLDRPEETRRLLRKSVYPWMSVIVAYIQSGQAHGRHREDVDAEAYVIHTLHLVIAAAASASVGQSLLSDDGSQRYERELARIAKASLFVR